MWEGKDNLVQQLPPPVQCNFKLHLKCNAMQRLHKSLCLTSQTCFSTLVPEDLALGCSHWKGRLSFWKAGGFLCLLPFPFTENNIPSAGCSTSTPVAAALLGGHLLQGSRHPCRPGKMEGEPWGSSPHGWRSCSGPRSVAPEWAVTAKGPVPQPCVPRGISASLGLVMPCKALAGGGVARRKIRIMAMPII